MKRDYLGRFVRYRVDLDGIIAAFPEIDVRLDRCLPIIMNIPYLVLFKKQMTKSHIRCCAYLVRQFDTTLMTILSPRSVILILLGKI